jgi:hypothetical protein
MISIQALHSIAMVGAINVRSTNGADGADGGGADGGGDEEEDVREPDCEFNLKCGMALSS